MKKILPLFFVVLTLFSCMKKTVTLETLLNEMVDRDAIAQFPHPGYTLKQFSSYDRATVAPGDKSWFANWDRSMFIRIDTISGRQEYVMMDMDGPGAIVRFWMTFAGQNSGKGIMRIYFDNDTLPAIEGTAFGIVSDSLLTYEPLASSVSDSTKYEMRGHNLYLPLPYSKHCMVTYQTGNIKDAGAKTGGEAVYYNIDYRSYKSGTKVVTWSADEMKKAVVTIEKVQQILATRDRGLEKLKPDSVKLSGVIAAGSAVSDTISGKQAIRMISVKVAPNINPQDLRSIVIKMEFDGEQTVWCPLGDFFGTGYHLRYSNTWYTVVMQDGQLSAYWVMPFKNSAIITLQNFGNSPVEISDGTIYFSPWKWNRNSMHFGTSWHQFTQLKTGERKDGEANGNPFDINYVELTGKGVYAGDAVVLFNTMYAWWGEGDEKVYVDGEAFPSSIGTGTEDYYGYAWSRPEKFANHPFIAQPDGSGNFRPGYTVNIRHRSLDAIPFNKSLKFDMEMWHWTKAVINHAPVTRFYMMPGGKTNIIPDTAGVLAPVALERSDIVSPLIINGRIEGENMVFGGATGGSFEYQNDSRFGWSENLQAFWQGGKPGQQLDLLFYSTDSLTANITAKFTLASDYGTFRLLLNDHPVKGNFNLYNEAATTKEMSLGYLPIKRGCNYLNVRTISASGKNGKAYFGLDYLEFSKK
jgi:hypothetical protein